MKKLLMFMLVGIFMLSFASAFEWDNVRDYNATTKTMTIDNALGFGDTIAEITLNTPLNYKVGAGYQKVAEFIIDNKEQYSEALRTMKFYDKNDNLKEFSRQFDYKVKTFEDVFVDDYSLECNELSNKTEVCNRVINGSHTERREVWTNLNSIDLAEGVYIIGIFTDVQIGDVVEWIPTFYGIEITEWAVWSQSLNLNITNYFKFDEQDITGGGVIIDSVSNNNATNNGASNTTGILLTAYDYDGINNFINLTLASVPIGGQSRTLNLWLNSDDITTFRDITSYGTESNGELFHFRQQNNGSIFFQNQPTGIQSNSTLSQDVWEMVTMTYDSATTTARIYHNATLVAEGSMTLNTGTTNPLRFGIFVDAIQEPWNGGIDEVGIWNRTLSPAEITQLFNNGIGITFLEDTVTLNSPINNLQTTNTTTSFSCSADFGISLNLENMSLYTNETGSFEVRNTTSGLSGTITTQIFNRTFTDVSMIWSCEACNQTGFCLFAEENRTLTVDNILPEITIETPVGLLDFNIIGNNQTLNVTVGDTNLNTCWFDYNGTNITIEGCVNGIKNSTQFILEEDNFNLTVYANDTIGNENSSFVSWNYNVLQNNQTFNLNTTEGSTESFTLNYLGNETPISASFIYNGVVTSADIDDSNFPIVILTESIVIPGVTGQTNLPFIWNIVTASSNVNTSETNQTVSDLSLDNCSTFTNVLFNLTVVDEATQLILNGSGNNVSVEVDVTMFSEDLSIQVINFSTEFNQTNPNAICSETDLFNGTVYILDAIFKYSAADRAIEYHNIRDSTIDNASVIQNITLFDIKTSESTEFQITFKNSDFVVVENALIQVNRQYVSEGVFKTVELPITDSNGQTIVHLVANDIVYNYIVTKNNVILGTFNNLIAFCDDASIGQCFISLNALAGTVGAFNPDTGSGISTTDLVFNSTSRDLTLSFTTNDGSVRTIIMNGTKMDQLGNTSVCLTTITSSSATLTCNIAQSLGNETIIIDVFVNDELALTSFFKAANDIDLGFSGLFLLLFLVVSLGLMFSESKSMTIMGIILGFVAGSMLFLIEGGIVGRGSAIMWLIIMGLILIWKLNQEGQT